MWLGSVILVVFIYTPFGVSNEAVIILARGGSKGVRLKNLQTVGGISLVGRAILTAKQAGFKDITVSTDHPLIALETLKFKANIFQRSYVTATDWAPSIWGVQEFLNTKPDVEIIILLQATSPLLKPNHLVLALKKFKRPIPFDCTFSVTRSHKLRWKYERFNMYPLNFDLKKRPRRQGWTGELIEAGAFYITRRNLIENGYFQNNNTITVVSGRTWHLPNAKLVVLGKLWFSKSDSSCTAWELPQIENLEVDTLYDINLANFIIANKLN